MNVDVFFYSPGAGRNLWLINVEKEYSVTYAEFSMWSRDVHTGESCSFHTYIKPISCFYDLKTNKITLTIEYGTIVEEYGNITDYADFYLKINDVEYINTTGKLVKQGEMFTKTITLDCEKLGNINMDVDASITMHKEYVPGWMTDTDSWNLGNTWTLPISNGHVKKNNVWKNAFAWLKKSGVWKRCIVWEKINGIWKKGD